MENHYFKALKQEYEIAHNSNDLAKLDQLLRDQLDYSVRYNCFQNIDFDLSKFGTPIVLKSYWTYKFLYLFSISNFSSLTELIVHNFKYLDLQKIYEQIPEGLKKINNSKNVEQNLCKNLIQLIFDIYELKKYGLNEYARNTFVKMAEIYIVLNGEYKLYDLFNFVLENSNDNINLPRFLKMDNKE